MTFKTSSGSSKPDTKPGEGLRGPDKQQDKLKSDSTSPVVTVPAKKGREKSEDEPEGLRRERKHPLNPSSGRA